MDQRQRHPDHRHRLTTAVFVIAWKRHSENWDARKITKLARTTEFFATAIASNWTEGLARISFQDRNVNLCVDCRSQNRWKYIPLSLENEKETSVGGLLPQLCLCTWRGSKNTVQKTAETQVIALWAVRKSLGLGPALCERHQQCCSEPIVYCLCCIAVHPRTCWARRLLNHTTTKRINHKDQ